MPIASRFLTVEEAARFLGYKKSYIYKLTHLHKLPFCKPFGGKILFDVEILAEYVHSKKVKTQEELEQEAIDFLARRGA